MESVSHSSHRIQRRFALVAAGVLLLAFLGAWAPAQDKAAQPNILLIVADDLGWKDVGWHGGRFKTPNMDKLVKEGVELDRHYVQPVCTPTRTALMSGRWTSRFGPHALAPSNLRVFQPGTITLASALKQSGYETYLSGKWHLGSKPEWGPNHFGFDHSYGSMAGAADPWTHKYRKGPYEMTWHRDLKVLEEDGNATELVAADAASNIRKAKGPWFVYVPFQAVHIPIDTPPQYKKLYEGVKFDDDPKKDESLHRYAAFVTQLDTKVGQLITALEESGQRNNTLVVFTSDNGGLPSGGNAYVSNVPPTPALSSNEPLRGHKNQLYEGGVRVCAFANWPGKLAPRKVTVAIHVADWMPTLTKLAGWSKPAEIKWDGQDVWPAITGQVDKIPPRAIYIPHQSGAIILRDGWKLIARNKGPAAGKVELFNVTEDPTETKELAATQPEKVKELEAILADLKKDDLTKIPEDLKGQKD